MGNIEDWADLMTDTISIEPFVSRNSYGAATFGTPVSYNARVNYKSQFVRGPDGSMVATRGNAIIAMSTPVSVNDRITLPDGTTPLILVSNLETDEDGPLYVRLDFG